MSLRGTYITQTNIHKLTQADILTFSSKEYWHKFIIENGGKFDKDAVLLSILDAINPFDLVPVKFTVAGNDAHFLARNCGKAIEKLCLSLLLPIPVRDNNGQIILSIKTCYISIDILKINMQHYLKKAIEKRHDKSQQGFINLSYFHKEPDLYDILFCPLSKPRFLLYVLSIIKRIVSVTSINLSNNEIDNIKPLEVLKDCVGLRCLDLSFNKIKNLDSMELISKAVPFLKDLKLRGNPLCNEFKSEMEYVKWIREKTPTIEKIDDVSINFGIPNQQVWLCNATIHSIVDQFLKHYFTLYEERRLILGRCYWFYAILSFVTDTPLNETSLDFKGFKINYQHEGRNYLESNEKTRIFRIYCCKNKNVKKLFLSLPVCKHDPYTFKVDAMFYKRTELVLMVSGICKEVNKLKRVRSFTRTFVLKKIAPNEYKISNDLYYVRNATDDEIRSSCFRPPPIDVKKLKVEP